MEQNQEPASSTLLSLALLAQDCSFRNSHLKPHPQRNSEPLLTFQAQCHSGQTLVGNKEAVRHQAHGGCSSGAEHSPSMCEVCVHSPLQGDKKKKMSQI